MNDTSTATTTNPRCRDGGPDWCCIDFDGTGLWCESCLDFLHENGGEARMALRYEVPPATPELRAAVDRLSDPRENGSSHAQG